MQRPFLLARREVAALAGALVLVVLLAGFWSAHEAARAPDTREQDRAARWWKSIAAALTGPVRTARVAALPPTPRIGTDPEAWTGWIERAACELGLPLCRVVDAEDRVTASNHWPASIGLPLPHADEGRAAAAEEPLAEGSRPAVLTAWALAPREPLERQAELTLVAGHFLDDPLFCPWPVARSCAGQSDVLLELASGGEPGWILIGTSSPRSLRRATRAILVPLLCATLAALIAIWTARRSRAWPAALARRIQSRFPDLAGTDRTLSAEEIDSLITDLSVGRAGLVQRLRSARRLAGWRSAGRALAHEVRNALTPVRLSLEMVYRTAAKDGRTAATKAEDPPEIRSLHAALRALGSAETLLDEFSDFARLPRGAPATVDLAHWLPEVVARWSPAGAIPVDVPDGPLLIEIDPARLERAVGNLLRNAQEAAGGGEIRVSLKHVATAQQTDRHAEADHPQRARITVWNAGPPIPDSLGKQIFAGGTTTKPAGSGLGLAIARSIALQAGGSLRYRNISGGVAFDLMLSLPFEADGPQKGRHEPAAPRKEQTPGKMDGGERK
jgi:signal transduction histidine kinase